MTTTTSFKLAAAMCQYAVAKTAALRADVVLQPHQQELVAKARTTSGVIANWRVGAGKTPGAIAVAEDRGGPTLVIGPAALRNNFRDSVEKFTTPDRHRAYHVVSYEQFIKDPHGIVDRVKPRTMILDEVHRLRNSGQAQAAVNSVRNKVPFALGLTGSLVNNHPSEIAPLVNTIAGHEVYAPGAFARAHIGQRQLRRRSLGEVLTRQKKPMVETIVDPKAIAKRVGPYVHRYMGDAKFNANFPAVHEQEISVPMSARQWDLYQNILKRNPNLARKIRNNIPPSKSDLKNINAFSVALRQISNTPASFDMSVKDPVAESPKFKRMIAEQHRMAKANPHFRSVVYSGFLESGVGPVTKALAEGGLPSTTFRGGMSDKQRAAAVGAFNAGRSKVLGISPAGGEGLDLKGVRLLQMTEDHWNPERGVQVAGRGARFRSHAHLPARDRNVLVQRFLSTQPPRFWHRVIKPDTTIDQWIGHRRKEKDRLNQEALSAL